jgi:sulfite exporter TauE/SafE
MPETSLLGAFLVGLLGGVHCVGMCGGIVGALTLGLPETVRRRPSAQIGFLLAYNGGRLASYGLAGALAGGLGAAAADLSGLHQARLALQVLAGVFMVLLGLYLGGWSRALAVVERAGGLLWRRIEPLGRRWLPVGTRGQALVLGLVWGWLPCGLVYSVLIWSLSAGSAGHGAALMLSFGLGTLPTLLAMGGSTALLVRLVRSARARQFAGALVIAFGLYQLWLAGRSLLSP